MEYEHPSCVEAIKIVLTKIGVKNCDDECACIHTVKSAAMKVGVICRDRLVYLGNC